MTREEAIDVYNGLINTKIKEAFEFFAPELREINEEEIRKDIIGGLMWQRDNLKSEGPHDNNLILPGFCFTVGEHLKYLEKQKENPKSTISIPADCASNARCEDRWYKVQDFTPADGRLVLAKDNIGNYFLASFAGGEWFVERYDLDDVPMKHTYVVEWCEIPSEQQKEQKPVEWSEEDEKMKERLITRLNWITYNTRTDGTSPNITFFDEIDWLKSLRPGWKPTEEQMEALNYAIAERDGGKRLEGLYALRTDLKKLI